MSDNQSSGIPSGLEALLRGMAGGAKSSNHMGQNQYVNNTSCPKSFQYAGEQWVIVLDTDEGWMCFKRSEMNQPSMNLQFIPLVLLANEYPEGTIPTSGYAWEKEFNDLLVEYGRLKHAKGAERIPHNDDDKYPYPVLTAEFVKTKIGRMKDQIREDIRRFKTGEEETDEE